jgi:hypothetical protein
MFYVRGASFWQQDQLWRSRLSAAQQDLGLQAFLYLRGTGVKGPGLAHIKKMSGLKTLDLSETPLEDVGLEHISGLTGIESLGLWNTRVTALRTLGLQQGAISAVAYDSSGNPSLSYSPGGLKFAHRNGASWSIQTIENGNWVDGVTSRRTIPSISSCFSRSDNRVSEIGATASRMSEYRVAPDSIALTIRVLHRLPSRSAARWKCSQMPSTCSFSRFMWASS